MEIATDELQRILPRLYTLQSISSTRIAKELNFSISEVRKLFTKLYSQGLYLKPDVCISKMGLRPVIILVRRRARGIKRDKAIEVPFLKTASVVPGYGVIFVLFLPLEARIVIDEVTVDENAISIFYYFYKLRSRISPKFIEMLSHSLSEVAITPPSEAIPVDETKLIKRSRLDSLDLKILEVVRSTPWISMRELASTVGIKRLRRLESHVRHAEDLISGYGYAKVGSLSDYGVMKLLFYRCRDASMFARSVLTHPFTVVTAWSRSDVFIQIYSPGRYGILFHHVLGEIAPSYGCEEVAGFDVVKERDLYAITSFPDVGVEYSKSVRGWVSTSSIKLSDILSCVDWGR